MASLRTRKSKKSRIFRKSRKFKKSRKFRKFRKSNIFSKKKYIGGRRVLHRNKKSKHFRKSKKSRKSRKLQRGGMEQQEEERKLNAYLVENKTVEAYQEAVMDNNLNMINSYRNMAGVSQLNKKQAEQLRQALLQQQEEAQRRGH